MTETIKQVILTVERNVYISADHTSTAARLGAFVVHSPVSNGRFDTLEDALTAAWTCRIMLALSRLGVSDGAAQHAAVRAFEAGEYHKGTTWHVVVRRCVTAAGGIAGE